MSARRKTGASKMKYWGFYAPPELKEETIEIASRPDVNESDSEYIRKAVEMRNAQYKKYETANEAWSKVPIPVNPKQPKSTMVKPIPKSK